MLGMPPRRTRLTVPQSVAALIAALLGWAGLAMALFGPRLIGLAMVGLSGCIFVALGLRLWRARVGPRTMQNLHSDHPAH